MTDVDFVNVYMGKLKDHLNDYLTKVVMLETHLELAGNKAISLQEELDVEKTAGEKLEKEKKQLTAELEETNKKYEETLSISEQLYAEKETLKEQMTKNNDDLIAPYVSKINTMATELESARIREENMTKDYHNLSAEFEELKTKYEKAISSPKTGVNTLKK